VAGGVLSRGMPLLPALFWLQPDEGMRMKPCLPQAAGRSQEIWYFAPCFADQLPAWSLTKGRVGGRGGAGRHLRSEDPAAVWRRERLERRHEGLPGAIHGQTCDRPCAGLGLSVLCCYPPPKLPAAALLPLLLHQALQAARALHAAAAAAAAAASTCLCS
jgi:hypothetical protein